MASQLQTNLIEIKDKLQTAGLYIDAIASHTEYDPLPYIELEYIENARPNDQEANIITNITTNTSYTLEVKFQYSINLANSDDRLFTGPERSGAYWLFGRYQNKFRLVYGSSTTARYSIAQDTNIHVLKLNNSYVLDNISYQTGISVNYSDTQVYCNALGCRLYYIKQYSSSGTMIHDCIPVKRKNDGMVCLYDKVTGTFYESNVSGGFIAGPEV